MGRRLAPVLGAALVLLPGAAAAHAPIPGVGAFWNGALHPVLVPAHLLALLAVGLALGQNAPHASRLALPAFAAVLAVALALAGPAGVAVPALLAVALSASLVVALGRAASLPVVAVAVAAAAAVGLDSAPIEAVPGEAGLAAAGTFAGATLVAVLSGGLAAATGRPWQRIAVRTVGSWIAGAAIIVLALFLGGTGNVG